MSSKLLALAGLLVLATSVAPVYADVPGGYYPPAPYSYGADRDDRRVVLGFVTYFHRYDLTLRARAGDFPVALHHGTIINPTGITLRPDMLVSVRGYWDNGSFHADRIDVLRFGYRSDYER